jgi:two-component system cell cycle response regulator
MPEKPSDKRLGKVPKAYDADIDRESTEIKASRGNVPKGRDRPFLIVIGGGSVGEMFRVGQKNVIIGRARAADIRLDDDGVSRRHAMVVSHGGQVHIEDLGSANGTFVNGEKVLSRHPLADGDKITLGSVIILKFTYSDELDETFQRKMFEAALRDGLTQAHNMRSFMDHMDKELAYARRHSMPLSLIMLDIDHFKKINDTFGHPAGDAVLINLVKVALDTLRKEDVFARYGGEEFAVICRGLDTKTATIVAERLRELIAKMRIEHEGREIAVTVSLGLAGYPDVDAEKPTQLILAADEALYQAKVGGRNRVVVKKAGR